MRKDIDLNFTMHPLTNDVVVKKGSAAIKQSLKNIIMTNYYERGFNMIGGNINRQMFEIMDSLTKRTIIDSVTQSIGNYEPAVELVSVEIDVPSNNEVVIRLTYNEFNSPENIVFDVPVLRVR